MSIIWCSISAHGFGHAAQVIPILNKLGSVVDNLHVILRTCVPSSFFQENLQVSWDLQTIPQDIGCIQRGPLDIDIEGTWAAYQEFHENWSQRVNQEAQAMRVAKANLVISNISHLAIASAFQADRPVVAIASLSWDQVLEPFIQPSRTDHRAIYEHIRQEYAKADRLIRLHPGIEMPAFSSIVDVGPSFPLTEEPSQDVRKLLGMESGEKLVFIAFGGIPLTGLPLKKIESCEGFHFLVGDILLNASARRIHRTEDLPLSFGEIMRQVDVVMTKPGYATIASAVHYDIPLVYVRRNNFVDEQRLVDYVHQHGRALELTRDDFETGAWEKTLQVVLTLPTSLEPPPKQDLGEIVGLLKDYLKE
jgi:hypothetical protein